MKKFVLMTCIVCTILTLPALSQGAEYMAGVRTGYFAWQPYLKEIDASGMSDIKWGTGVLYGPIFSIMFTDDLSISVSALFGKQSTHWQSEFSYFDSSTRITGNYYFEGFRADVDSALSYRLSQYFKVFAGYKYQYMAMDYNYTELRTDSSNNITDVQVGAIKISTNLFHGPALGLGFNYPITDVYFFSINVSGLYMTGDIEFKVKGYESDPLKSIPDEKIESPIRQIGINVEPVIGMNPGNNLPIITVGIRYQKSRLQITSSELGLENKWLDDTIAGAFISIVFMF
ncbi:MAG: porin family protein [Spirochaetes bacterium]|nr:porin family protein [Spirochaetota bacterium]